jgi:hypothetical protein
LKLVSSIHFNLMNPSSKHLIHFLVSSMYMWKNIFHVIPMWHRDILRIFCPCHKNIPNMFVPTHMFMFTCALPNIVGLWASPTFLSLPMVHCPLTFPCHLEAPTSLDPICAYYSFCSHCSS